MVAEGYKETEIGVIPVEWDITTVGNSSKNFDGQRVPLKSEDRQAIQGEYPYYGAQGIIDYVNDYIFDGEYLLVAEDGENVKGQKYDIAFIVNGKFWVNNHAHILQANDNMNLYFISSILNHINIIQYVTGTGQPKLNKAQLNSITIPLPPLKEQEKIADILTTADEKIDAIASQIEKAETLKKGLLQKLLSEGIGHSEFKDSELGKIPESWEVVELPHLTDKITSGGTPSRKKAEYFENGTVNWIKTGELRDCYIYNSKEKITEDAVANSSAKVFPVDTLLIAMYGATIGRTAYLKTECSTNQACCAIIFNQSIADPYFYWKYFHFIKDDLISQGRGAGQPNISQSIIKTLLIPLPPLKEQKQIADILSTADEKLEVLRAKKQMYETLKKGLLQKLLSGEVRV